MNIASIFIRRPIATTLCMLSILLFGVIAYRLLPVSDLPNVDRATINVSASYPGANADTMASTVATPLSLSWVLALTVKLAPGSTAAGASKDACGGA